MFKTETHLHTAPVSNCGRLSPEEMIDQYHEVGYTTVFISDHFANHHFNLLGDGLSWEQKTDMLYNAYLKAKAHGEKYGMHVLFSPELSLQGNHFLLYGVDKAFLNLRDDIFDMSLKDFYHHAKAYGITIIQAHPYRDGVCTPQVEFIDGIEAINSNPRHENFDTQCFELAAKYQLPMSAGSDAHRYEDVAGSAMVSQEPITSAEQYVSLLKERKLQLMRHEEIVSLD